MKVEDSALEELRAATNATSPVPKVETEQGGIDALRTLHAKSTAAQMRGPLADKRKAAIAQQKE